jgi:uncharacterized protein with GYD domain
MTTYVMLTNWTDQGLKAIAECPRHLDAAKKTLEHMGGHFRTLYMTMGQFDLVGIYNAPDDAVAARFGILLGQLGNIRTAATMKAFPEEAYRQIVNHLH